MIATVASNRVSLEERGGQKGMKRKRAFKETWRKLRVHVWGVIGWSELDIYEH